MRPSVLVWLLALPAPAAGYTPISPAAAVRYIGRAHVGRFNGVRPPLRGLRSSHAPRAHARERSHARLVSAPPLAANVFMPGAFIAQEVAFDPVLGLSPLYGLGSGEFLSRALPAGARALIVLVLAALGTALLVPRVLTSLGLEMTRISAVINGQRDALVTQLRSGWEARDVRTGAVRLPRREMRAVAIKSADDASSIFLTQQKRQSGLASQCRRAREAAAAPEHVPSWKK